MVSKKINMEQKYQINWGAYGLEIAQIFYLVKRSLQAVYMICVHEHK